MAGAGWTTFDALQGGCKDSKNGIDCNNYEKKKDVYMSGGPVAGGLSDGNYFFAVLVPGYQNGGFLEGADGNLSDETKGKTKGDGKKCGDNISMRTFTVANHEITVYAGDHKTGTSPNGKFIIQLMPYCNTSNNGGVYILAICQVGATSPSQCKYDAFRVRKDKPHDPPTLFPVISGLKYYDANVNGQYDAGEVGLAAWPINVSSVVTDTVFTAVDGTFSVELVEGAYSVAEVQAGYPWIQTGNTVNQTVVTGGATASLNPNMSYAVGVVDNSTVSGLNFGNVCLGLNGGGHTMGFWSNVNGQALFDGGDLALLVNLNLRNDNGTHFDPATYGEYRTWLLAATPPTWPTCSRPSSRPWPST